jgi:type III secretory pathway lipoprotein EscJ
LNRDGIAVSTARDPAEHDRFQLEVSGSAVAAAVQTLKDDRPRPAEAVAEAPLIPTRAGELRAREDALRLQLTAAIERLPGVHAASVQVTLPAPASSLDRLGQVTVSAHAPPQRATASAVVLRDAGSAPVATRARELIAASVPGIDARAIKIVESERTGSARACAPLAHLGPVTLTTTSMGTLRAWLVASALINMLCAVALLVLLRRNRRARTRR